MSKCMSKCIKRNTFGGERNTLLKFGWNLSESTSLWNTQPLVCGAMHFLQILVLLSFWRKNWLQSTHRFQENIILVNQFSWYKILMAKIQFVLSHYLTSSTFGVALKTEKANLWIMEMFYSSASGSKTKRNIVMGNKRWKGQYTEGTPFGRKVAAGPFWPCFACPKLGYAGRTQVAKMGWCNEELASHNFDLKQNPPERIFYIYMEYPLRRILL